MTLGLRLLRGYVGNSLAAPPTPFLVSTQQGFWNEVSEPSAAYYNGVTYMAWCDDSQHLWACSWNHATQTASTPYDLGLVAIAVDGAIHLAPAIMVRSSDHRILVFGVANGSGKPAVWTSTNPEDATAFGAAALFSDTQVYTYSHIAQLATGDLYYFTYVTVSGTRYLCFNKSTDGGSTWSARTNLLAPGSTTSFYARVGTNGTLMDIFATDTNRLLATPSSVYHFRFDGATLTTSDGTTVSGAWPRPVTDGTLVQNASLGSARSLGWGYQPGNGRPACCIGVNSGGTTTLLRRALWTGSAWSVVAVADAGGIIDSNVFISGAAMSKADPDTLWLSQKVSSHFELYRYQTFDGGSTWTDTAVTSGSSADNAMPDTPVDAAAGFQVIYGLGTFTSNSNFDFDVYGAGT